MLDQLIKKCANRTRRHTEHFATPLHFAFSKFGLSEHATLRSFPSGTGTMIEAFNDKEIDVGIGLTEAWVAGLGKRVADEKGERPVQTYHITGKYTTSPLLWALSTGGQRKDINNVNELRGKKVGISRYGSGSHIMSFVLADQQGWLDESGKAPFEFVVCGPFAPLREAVNSGKADFFMWEHFTSKKFFDNGELKRIGEIPTPWDGWHIASHGTHADERVVDTLLPALQKGVEHFENNKEDAVELISTTMEYSREDAEEWYKTVSFPQQPGSLDEGMIKKTFDMLKKAGVLSDQAPEWSTYASEGNVKK